MSENEIALGAGVAKCQLCGDWTKLPVRRWLCLCGHAWINLDPATRGKRPADLDVASVPPTEEA